MMLERFSVHFALLMALLGLQPVFAAQEGPLTDLCEPAFSGGQSGERPRVVEPLYPGERFRVGAGAEAFLVTEQLGRGSLRTVFQAESLQNSENLLVVSLMPPGGSFGFARIQENKPILREGLRRFYSVTQEFLRGPVRPGAWSPYVRIEIEPVDLVLGSEGERFELGMVGEYGLSAERLLETRASLGEYSVEELKLRLVLGEELSRAVEWFDGNELEHLDIKLGNVVALGEGEATPENFLSGQRFFALADHGLLRRRGRLFEGDAVYGTPQTMGPEQMTGEVVGRPGMIFSVGMTVLQSLWTDAQMRETVPAVAGMGINPIRNRVEQTFQAEIARTSGERRDILMHLKHFLLSRLVHSPQERELQPSWIQTGDARQRHWTATQTLVRRRSRMRSMISSEMPELLR